MIHPVVTMQRRVWIFTNIKRERQLFRLIESQKHGMGTKLYHGKLPSYHDATSDKLGYEDFGTSMLYS